MAKNIKKRHKFRPSVRDRTEVHRSELEKLICYQDSGYDAYFHPLFPRKLYKYVDVGHSQAVQDGSIKIGTIRGYAELENGREDNEEGTSTIYPTNISLQEGEGEDIRQGMREMGLHVDGSISMHGVNNSIKMTSESTNFLCYCFSLSPCSRSLLKDSNQTVFEIVSFDRFLFRLLDKLKVDVAWVGAVEYSSRTFTKFNDRGSKSPNAWRKPYRRERDGYRYDSEREYRIIMMPQENVSTEPYGPDPLLAPFFRKLTTKTKQNYRIE